MTHRCYCGVDYECPYCGTPESFICPSLNGDEDGWMCDECLEKQAVEMQKFVDEQNLKEKQQHYREQQMLAIQYITEGSFVLAKAVIEKLIKGSKDV